MISLRIDDAGAELLRTLHGKSVLENVEPPPEAFRHAGDHRQAVAFLQAQLGGAAHLSAAVSKETEHGDEWYLVDEIGDLLRGHFGALQRARAAKSDGADRLSE